MAGHAEIIAVFLVAAAAAGFVALSFCCHSQHTTLVQAVQNASCLPPREPPGSCSPCSAAEQDQLQTLHPANR